MSEQVDHKVVIDSTPETTNDGVDFKVDLNNPPKPKEDAIQEQETEGSVLRDSGETESAGQDTEVGLLQTHESQPEKEEVDALQQESESEEASSEEESSSEEAEEQEEVLNTLPENVDKLVKFMEETGGTIEDYVRLNADYSTISEDKLIEEYYAKTKPHLDAEDIKYMMEDFKYDEDLDDESEIRKKKIAYKEEIAKARNFLEDTKNKYYDEIKANKPAADPNTQKAIDFFNRYTEQQTAAAEKSELFSKRTDQLFNQEFEGFDFNVGENKFKYEVSNPSQVAKSQSNIENFFGKFLDKNGQVKDYKQYHKAIYAAENADSIAKHFYEQGKADATKNITAQSKNIQGEAPRQTAGGDVFINGLKVKAISGADSGSLRIRKK